MSEMLATYLQDHHAGSTIGVELARRAAGSNRDSPYGEKLARIAEEISEDRETLKRVMDELGVRANPIKDCAAWTFEKFGRLKPNNRVFEYSPLSRVVELEGLMLGVTGKLALWESLRGALGDSHAGFDFVALAQRASDQRERLELMRREAAAEALKPE